MTYPIRILGNQVVLHEFSLEDVDDVLAIIGDDKVTTWLSFDSRNRDQAVAMIEGALERAQQEPRTEFYFGVTKRDGDRVIGFARIGLSGVQAGKLGYAIAATEWGRSYATDAARALVTYAFKEIGLHRITAAIGSDNAASIAVVQQLGFAARACCATTSSPTERGATACCSPFSPTSGAGDGWTARSLRQQNQAHREPGRRAECSDA